MDAAGSDDDTPWFGGDYNPEQWPESVRAADLAAFAELGVNTVTLGVFAWALLHPAKGRYELGWLDRTVDAVTAHGVGVVLATPTAAQPPWMSAAYPEILPVDAAGRRRRHGGRVNYCPSSTAYREESAEIAAVLAERYRGLGGLRLWHVNNEYGPVCYCDRCADGFRRWLAERYGDLAALNEAWGTNVWGNTLGDWSEVELPSQLNAMRAGPWDGAPGRVSYAPNPGIAVDHARYCSTILLECYRNERAAIREHSADVPVTTNFHGPVRVVDWHQWAPHCDLVSWDSYPVAGEHWAHAAFGHDLARGAGGTGELLVMEAAPGPVNWHERSALKRPGEVRLEALQATARGSRGMLYFQVRQAVAGAELNHSALIPRHGRLDTRTGRELAAASADLRALAGVVTGLRPEAAVALVFDWASWWAQHHTPGLDQRSRYLAVARDVHRALAERGRVVDIVAATGPFEGYAAVVAPLLHVADGPTLDALGAYVRGGGVLVTTTGSGIAGAAAQVHRDGVDPAWRALVGLWVEETDARPADRPNPVRFDGAVFRGRELFDVVRLETAEAVASFADDFYAGSPAVAVNRVAAGAVAYVASLGGDLVAEVLERYAPSPPAAVTAPDQPAVERVAWAGGAGCVFVLNHGDVDAAVELRGGAWVDVLSGSTHRQRIDLGPKQAAVLTRRREGPPDQSPATIQGEPP